MIYDNNKTHTLKGLPSRRINDAAIASGLAFLTGELEKRDPKLYEPLTSVTWQRDIVANMGGGWVEFTSNYYVDYATSGDKKNGLIGGATNDIPVINANITKDNYKVFNWANVLAIPFVDQQMLNTVGRSLDNLLDKGVRLSWNKALDGMVYEGNDEANVYGLINNPAITADTVADGKAGTGKTQWKDKTADEIVADINEILVETWEAAEYDLSGMANHILIDPANYAIITSRKVSEAGNISVLEYVLQNNIAKNQGRDIVIVPCRWCTGAGTGSKNRMVGYVMDRDFVSIDIPVSLGRVITETSALQMAYLTTYAGQIGQVKFNYPQCVRYKDGI